jgi:hypothetical protein
MAASAKKRGLDEFRAAHDKSFIVPSKIRAGLADLGDAWEYENEFISRCKLSTTDFSRYRDPFMSKHVVEVAGSNGRSSQKRVWCGTAAFAAKLRAKVVE